MKELRFTTGGRLYLHYIKDESAFGRFQGIDLSHVYIDESGQIPDPAPILRIRSSMRSTVPGVVPRMVLSCNPTMLAVGGTMKTSSEGATPWKPLFCELFRKEVVLIHSTLYDNPHIVDRETYIEALKASCNFDESKIQGVYGSWGSVGGSFFGHVWNQQRIPSAIHWWAAGQRSRFQLRRCMDELGLGDQGTFQPVACIPDEASTVVGRQVHRRQQRGAGG